MTALTVLVATGTTPTPSPSAPFDPDQVTPGPWGFIAVAFLAVAVILLVWDMLRRIRRARYREEVNALLDAEQAEAAGPAAAGTAADAEAGDAGDDEPGSRRS